MSKKEDIEKAIKRDLPGWKLSESSAKRLDKEEQEKQAKNTKDKTITVKVPLGGTGPLKVADYNPKTGKTTIVQG